MAAVSFVVAQLWFIGRTFLFAWVVTTTLRQLYNRFVVYKNWPSPNWTLPILGNTLQAGALLRFLMRMAKQQRGESFLFWPGGSKPVAIIVNASAREFFFVVVEKLSRFFFFFPIPFFKFKLLWKNFLPHSLMSF